MREAPSPGVPPCHTCDSPSHAIDRANCLTISKLGNGATLALRTAHDQSRSLARSARSAVDDTGAADRSPRRRHRRLGAGIRVRPRSAQSRPPGRHREARRRTARSRAPQRTGGADRRGAAAIRRRSARRQRAGAARSASCSSWRTCAIRIDAATPMPAISIERVEIRGISESDCRRRSARRGADAGRQAARIRGRRPGRSEGENGASRTTT